jgi:hypothetical protein
MAAALAGTDNTLSQSGLFSLAPCPPPHPPPPHTHTKAGLDGWGDSSLSKMLAVQTEGPAFKAQNPGSLMRCLLLVIPGVGR